MRSCCFGFPACHRWALAVTDKSVCATKSKSFTTEDPIRQAQGRLRNTEEEQGGLPWMNTDGFCRLATHLSQHISHLVVQLLHRRHRSTTLEARSLSFWQLTFTLNAPIAYKSKTFQDIEQERLWKAKSKLPGTLALALPQAPYSSRWSRLRRACGSAGV